MDLRKCDVVYAGEKLYVNVDDMLDVYQRNRDSVNDRQPTDTLEMLQNLKLFTPPLHEATKWVEEDSVWYQDSKGDIEIQSSEQRVVDFLNSKYRGELTNNKETLTELKRILIEFRNETFTRNS